jgi:peptidoglycan/xylan/chitin deacetylase (PgdA/CDA1 family)
VFFSFNFARELCNKLDYRIVLWSIDTEDWRHTPPEEIVSRVIREVKGGDIILMHDYIGKGSPTPAALKKIIPALIARGYRFVLVSELLNIGADPTESEVNR